MPTYEYKCEACGHSFERFQSMSAEPIKRCPQCGKAKVKRLIGTGAGLIFKGSGFYITDYRDAGYKDKAKAESGSSGGGGGGDKPAEGAACGGGDAKTSKDGAAPKADSKPAPAKAEKKSSASAATKN